MNQREYYEAGEKLVPTELSREEFETEATYQGWSAVTIALMLRPPVMTTPFQMGRWLVTLVDRRNL